MLRSERVEDADDHTPDVLATPVRRRQCGEQLLERVLQLAPVERGEGVRELAALLQTQASGEAVGLEAAADVGENLEGLVALAPGNQDLRERNGGLGPARLELQGAPQITLLAARDEQVRLGGEQRVEEALDGLPALRADEFVHHAPVSERLDSRDAADLKGLRQVGVRIGVELGEHHLPLALRGGLLEQRPELAAGTAPSCPEVHDDRQRRRALDHLALEIRLAYI